MSSRNHVVITGTGRNGTTFLVELLTHIGLETGFSAEDIATKKSKEGRAGLEFDIRQEECPYIVKSPWFCDYAEEVICREDIIIEHIFIPIRDLNAAAESRRYVVKSNVSKLSLAGRLKHMIKPQRFDGGLWHTNSSKPSKQEETLLRQIYKLILAVSRSKIPVTFIHYPRLVNDCPYLFEKLNPILRDFTYESFYTVYSKTVRPDLIHSFNKNDR